MFPSRTLGCCCESSSTVIASPDEPATSRPECCLVTAKPGTIRISGNSAHRVRSSELPNGLVGR
jgi:hypothetical protein